MIIGGQRASILLFIGDVVALFLSLYITLAVRYVSIPAWETLNPYRIPFSFLFALWLLIFYSAGLYGKRLALFPSRLPETLWRTQLINMLLAVVFFFSIPAFGITPKTILAIYFGISLILILLWRRVLYPKISLPNSRNSALLLAEGDEAEELRREVQGNPHYSVMFVPRERRAQSVDFIVLDTNNEDLKISSESEETQLVPFRDLYEEVFDRVSLQELNGLWFRQYVRKEDPMYYLFIKRVIDIVGALIMGVVTIVSIPFVLLANAFEGTRPLFIKQTRLGKGGTHITVYKFRSMTNNHMASDQWIGEGKNRITKVGAFLRKTSLDEFPQCINIVKGELSLIGPRNDILGLGDRLKKALPYYEARYKVKPGITGWAQINQQYEEGHTSPQSIEETKVRLAYDFYYLKHRSLALDISIALKTIKRMFFRLSN